MHYIFWTNKTGIQQWELIEGEDAMQIRVSEISDRHELNAEDVHVFSAESERRLWHV